MLFVLVQNNQLSVYSRGKSALINQRSQLSPYIVYSVYCITSQYSLYCRGLESVQSVLPDLAVQSLDGLGPGSVYLLLPATGQNRAGQSRGTERSRAEQGRDKA